MLKFDHRTSVDLKDKYRNMLKKGLFTEIPVEGGSSSPRQSPDANPENAASSTLASRGRKGKRSNVLDSLPTIKGIVRGDDDWGCLMSMEEVGERLVPLEDIPVNLLPAFKAYNRYLKEQLRLTHQTMLLLSTKDKRMSGKRTKYQVPEEPENNERSRIRSDIQSSGQDKNHADEQRLADGTGEASLDSASPHKPDLPPKATDKRGADGDVQERDRLRAKRTRLVSKMREARQSTDGRTCLMQ